MSGAPGQVIGPGKDQPGLSRGEDFPWGAAAFMLCSRPTVLREGAAVSVGLRQVAGQEAQEGEYQGHTRRQGRWLAPDCSLGEPVLGVTGLSPRVSDVEEIFMQESDALNFLKKRSKRSPRFQDEVNGKTLWPAFCSCSFLFLLSPSQLGCEDGQGRRAQPRSSGVKVTVALSQKLYHIFLTVGQS